MLALNFCNAMKACQITVFTQSSCYSWACTLYVIQCCT